MYTGIFETREDLIKAFEIQESDLDGCEILFACYEIDCYEGSAFILLRKDGKLYEVNGGHCSCYGLEGQWELEGVNIEALKQRVKSASYYYCYAGYKGEILGVLSNYEED